MNNPENNMAAQPDQGQPAEQPQQQAAQQQPQPQQAQQPMQQQPAEQPQSAAMDSDKSDKSNLVAFLLCFFIGILGVHRFYVGKIGTGVAMILTLGGLGIWSLIDFIMIICGKFKDKEGKPLKW